MPEEMWIGFLLLGVSIVCLILALVMNREKRKKYKKEPPRLKINISSGDGDSAAKKKADTLPDDGKIVESLDSIYARNVGKKLCPYCETVNLKEAGSCCACGNRL